MTCPFCEDLLCAMCHRPVYSGKAPSYPGRLCTQCYFGVPWEPLTEAQKAAQKAYDNYYLEAV